MVKKFDTLAFYDSVQAAENPSRGKQRQTPSEDEWERPQTKKKPAAPGKSQKQKQQHSRQKQTNPTSSPGVTETPQKQTKIPEFFSPSSPFSPSPHQTVNGRPVIADRQRRITQFLQNPAVRESHLLQPVLTSLSTTTPPPETSFSHFSSPNASSSFSLSLSMDPTHSSFSSACSSSAFVSSFSSSSSYHSRPCAISTSLLKEPPAMS